MHHINYIANKRNVIMIHKNIFFLCPICVVLYTPKLNTTAFNPDLRTKILPSMDCDRSSRQDGGIDKHCAHLFP